jgi:hypothetical protein
MVMACPTMSLTGSGRKWKTSPTKIPRNLMADPEGEDDLDLEDYIDILTGDFDLE